MRIKREKLGQTKVTLDPGDYFVTESRNDLVISTLLGSCVSACLYDPVNRIMGMNHFLLSNRRYKKDGPLITTEAGRYGIHAMELVINMMFKLGASTKNLKAKAFGGGNITGGGKQTSNFFCVGEVNSRFIVEFLKNENIPLESSDLGGINGRIIRFDALDFSVYVKKIKPGFTVDLVERDKNYWDEKVREEEAKSTEIDLW